MTWPFSPRRKLWEEQSAQPITNWSCSTWGSAYAPKPDSNLDLIKNWTPRYLWILKRTLSSSRLWRNNSKPIPMGGGVTGGWQKIFSDLKVCTESTQGGRRNKNRNLFDDKSSIITGSIPAKKRAHNAAVVHPSCTALSNRSKELRFEIQTNGEWQVGETDERKTRIRWLEWCSGVL